jgi:ectoine hydroxylase-related dioxygenase (phytanoyl-CoA dioxygenase family)
MLNGKGGQAMNGVQELRKLTDAEFAEYEEQGFVIIPNFLPQEEVDSINSEYERLIAADKAEPASMLRLGLRSEFMQSMVAHPRILALVERIVFPGIAIYSAKMVSKVPKGPKVDCVCHWHQDDAYYVRHSQSQRRMSIWLGLHDSDVTNAGVWFLPGSHKRGLREHANLDHGQCRKSIEPSPDEIRDAVCPTIRAGSIVLFSALMWHHSTSNTSDRLRRAFIVSYQEASVVGGNEDQWRILSPA